MVGFFHELYATGKFPSKTWLSSPWQHHIFRETLELCVAGITSNSTYIEQMKRDNAAHRPLMQAGVCSNVGEVESPLPVAGRPRRMVVFGKYTTRIGLYQRQMPVLQKLITHLRIDEVADIGDVGPASDSVTRFSGALEGKLNVYGPLPASDVGALLTQSVAGAVAYRYNLRFKSGVVAAYQAHALPVILFTPPGDAEPLMSEPDYLSPAQVLEQTADSAGLMNLFEDAAAAGFAVYREFRSCDSILRQILPWLRLD